MFDHILYDVDEAIATISLNRPDKLNAYIPAMGEEVVSAFARARDDDEVRVVVLTGVGRGFCAGVDLEHLKASFAEAASSAAPQSGKPRLGEEDFLRKLPLELIDFPKPVIAAINGHAIGVGITMALPCDLRIAAAGAKIGLTFAKLGILPGLGATHLLPRLVGMAKAQELVLSARVILAEEACEIGLVNRVVPAEELMKEVRELAQQIAAHDPEVLARAKRSLYYGASVDMAEAMQNEQRTSAELRAHRGAKGS
ncbi:MAG: enoyl-CoA hydratase/isomerase family protein [Deltaproteobacteria bacterium]|nr:enoyl-CoA hydratase/isomerase family protein [Deltaproteobacteria bacterium]MBW2388499.1 enoyl-CoA hydratase/isomerase family protein [Deltaproteobacteria bacterium]MBW2725060.1 enoyl-CoA hydratase/isomerase family protein [Deltaproteobacteria bacterium]